MGPTKKVWRQQFESRETFVSQKMFLEKKVGRGGNGQVNGSKTRIHMNKKDRPGSKKKTHHRNDCQGPLDGGDAVNGGRSPRNGQEWVPVA